MRLLPRTHTSAAARLARSAQQTRRTMTTAKGPCPNCDATVVRFQRTAGASAAETFSCPTCGVFSYTTEGARLPLVVPVPS